MSLGKGDPVPPPPGKGEFHIRFGNREAAVGWRELCKKAPGNTLVAWQAMRTGPAPVPPTQRHHRLKGDLANGTRNGKALPQWQIEVTGGGRLWYLFDEGEQTCWLVLARTGHPRQTD
ncbi:hypothetical protein [Streptomyces pini]|uniref:Type II toxin-antitoxin system RelE/ParE family toxin n=1 Tax=Streptomyces pini TaxID=1520580 RepID=A0A1I3U6Z8_9ACTN|nr:hypothetical protein [Streptomyces pini]SFJ79348.1 hypothetical protein SAMN05192584_101350 [Streptomyces pini]